MRKYHKWTKRQRVIMLRFIFKVRRNLLYPRLRNYRNEVEINKGKVYLQLLLYRWYTGILYLLSGYSRISLKKGGSGPQLRKIRQNSGLKQKKWWRWHTCLVPMNCYFGKGAYVKAEGRIKKHWSTHVLELNRWGWRAVWRTGVQNFGHKSRMSLFINYFAFHPFHHTLSKLSKKAKGST